MQRPGEPGAARFGPPEGCADHRPHRYRSFMIEEILTEPPGPKGAAPAAAAAAAGELLKFGVQALLAARPFHSHLAVLKAEQAAVFKFPLAPLGCSGLGSALLAAGPGLPGAAGAPHLPLELQLRGKLEAPGAGEPGTKAKKGRRSRTVFTELQLMGLEKRFEKQKYLSTPDRIDLAESLGLSQLQVKTWYQNRRMKWKKIVSLNLRNATSGGLPCGSLVLPQGSPLTGLEERALKDQSSKREGGRRRKPAPEHKGSNITNFYNLLMMSHLQAATGFASAMQQPPRCLRRRRPQPGSDGPPQSCQATDKPSPSPGNRGPDPVPKETLLSIQLH
ncbi:hypothetical protein MJT46_005002 [Ovis ammon polii x Ovis aries]|nr:hypothetical protein MJT46_005002 [Ovis ammon polii x Ovis aries]